MDMKARNAITAPRLKSEYEPMLAAVGSPPIAQNFSEEEKRRIIADADAVRAKLAKLGITEADVADAIKWARNSQ